LSPPLGAIVEYETDGEFCLGYVLEAGRSVLIVRRDGEQLRVDRNRLTQGQILTWPADLRSQVAAKRLGDLNAEVETLQADGDLEAVWSLLEGSVGASTEAELADLLFGVISPLSRLATARLLRADPAWFAPVRDGFERRTPGEIADLRRIEEAAHLASLLRRAFSEALRPVLAASARPRAERREALEVLCSRDDFRERLELLEAYAIHGDDLADGARARTLLDEIASDGVALREHGSERAFELLVRSGWFHPHENTVLRKQGWAPPFTTEEIASAGRTVSTLPQREDLTHLECFTIDHETTRDMDDALSLEATGDGGYRLGIHISDVASAIPLDSPLDLAARARGTSVYFPEDVVPMFPRNLSEDGLSLVPGERRSALSFLVDYDAANVATGYRLALTSVTSHHRLTYNDADAMLAGGEGSLYPVLQHLQHIADDRRDARLGSGAVIMDIPTPSVELTHSQQDLDEVVSVRFAPALPSPSRDLVEEFMIFAGELAADFASKRSLPILYRTQPPPDRSSIEQAISGRVLPFAEAHSIRRFMRRAETSTRPAAHFGLGVVGYAQVTSPIRRYSDLVCHRQLRAALIQTPAPWTEDDLLEIAANLEARSRDAAHAVRQRRRYWALVCLSEDGRASIEGTGSTAEEPRGTRLQVVLDEVLLPVSVPSGRRTLGVGDRVRVKIDSIHPRRGVLRVSLAR
jgi:exoribonuclease-2